MDVMIYENYGVLAHEKEPVYTVAPCEHAVVSKPFYISIPESLHPYMTQSGEVALEIENTFAPYLLSEALITGTDGMPRIQWIDKSCVRHAFIPGTYGV